MTAFGLTPSSMSRWDFGRRGARPFTPSRRRTASPIFSCSAKCRTVGCQMRFLHRHDGRRAFQAGFGFGLHALFQNQFRLCRGDGNTKQLADHYAAVAANYDPSAQTAAGDVSRQPRPAALFERSAATTTDRLKVALAFLYTAQGIPCLYYGTEQAFNGAKTRGTARTCSPDNSSGGRRSATIST